MDLRIRVLGATALLVGACGGPQPGDFVIVGEPINGVEPQAYIADVIEKIASGWPASRWDELMPWNWTAAATPVSPIAVKRAA